MAQDDFEQLRIGIVMNGGVSLAVWMGGVTTEIDRLRRKVGAYGEVLDLTCSTPLVDVIAGTSAGGINGAVLAAAIGRKDQPLDGIRDLWVNKGSLVSLLRSPFETNPVSILRGDEYFLERLREGFAKVAGPKHPPQATHDPDAQPIHLTMLTATLQPTTRALADDFGSTIPDVTHVAELTFRRDRVGDATDDGPRDDWKLHDLVDRLALAARCSASFPGAFEASFCPVGETLPKRPDMAPHATFRTSRYTVDGGTVMNKPFAPALRAIYEQTATNSEDLVRRVLLYVVPDPGDISAERPEQIKDEPSIMQTVLAGGVTMPRAESVAEELREIRTHNDRVAYLQKLRDDLLTQDLETLATHLFPAYISQRRTESVDRILTHLDNGAFELGITSRNHTRETVRAALLEARSDYLPSEPPAEGASLLTERWQWGLAPLEHACMTVLSLLLDGLALAGNDQPELRRSLRASRARVHELRRKIRKLHFVDAAHWKHQASDLEEATNLEQWAGNAFREWKEAADAHENDDSMSALANIGRDLALILLSAREDLLRVADVAEEALLQTNNPARDLRAQGTALRKRVVVLFPMRDVSASDTEGEMSADTTLRVLLSLEVALTVFTRISPECEQHIEFMLISGNTPNPFDQRTRVEEKLAGVQLGHFGAFYKPSWRASDWMWGRLDGAFRLSQALVDPKRLAQLGLTAEEAMNHIEAIALAKHPDPNNAPHPDLQDMLVEHANASGWNVAARKELAYLDDPVKTIPPTLPACAAGIARRIQIEILHEEMPLVLDAIDLDRAEGADLTPNAKYLREAAPRSETLGPRRTLSLFQKSEIGLERIADDIGSDLFTKTVSQAAAVAVSAISSKRSGLGPLRSIVGSLRTFVLAFYLLAQSAVRKSKTGFAFTVLLFAVGAFVVTSDFASNGSIPNNITIAGAGIIAAGVLMTGLRSGSPLGVPALLVLTGLAAAAPFLIIQDGTQKIEGVKSWRTILRPALSLVALVLVPLLVGHFGGIWRRRRRSQKFQVRTKRTKP